MKKKSVINLIRYHAENCDAAFRSEACEIAREFDADGDTQLAEYIMALLSGSCAVTPQSNDGSFEFFRKLEPPTESISLPHAISNDITGVINAMGYNVGVNKFLFQGPPGTGKTETVRQIGSITERDVFIVDFNTIIDSLLGNTAKNVHRLFNDINSIIHPEKAIILFDEIDSLALDRINQHDVREMGRATSSFLRELDNLSDDVVLIATTNLYDSFDKALLRRFDAIIDFGRYTRDDLLEIANRIMEDLTVRFRHVKKDKRLFHKVMTLMDYMPYPGDLKNMLKSAVAFSDPNDGFDYMKRLYKMACPDGSLDDLNNLYSQGFTILEIETLSGVPRSTVSCELKLEKES